MSKKSLTYKRRDELEQEIKDFKSASCRNCKWLLDEVCVNGDSLQCIEYPNTEMMCNLWEKIK